MSCPKRLGSSRTQIGPDIFDLEVLPTGFYHFLEQRLIGALEFG